MFLAPFKSLRLRSQITWLFIALIFLTTLAIMASIWLRTAEYSHNIIERRVESAQRVLNQYLTAREQLLITAARVLTADFGFKQAVATSDANTIVSALNNHGRRIKADVMMLLDTEGVLNHLSVRDNTKKDVFQEALDGLPLRLDNSQFLVVNKNVYQVLVLPIKAPRLIAYSVIGFKLDMHALSDLQELTGLDISLIEQDDVLITSLDSPQKASIFWNSRKAEKSKIEREIEHPLYRHRVIDFGEKTGLSALLTASLQQENEDYYRLLYSVVFIAVITLLIALISIRLLAKGITIPLSNLVMLTKQVAKGEFSHIEGNAPKAQEFRELEQAFFNMGQEISERESEIIYQAKHDLLTGLLNRHTLQKELDSSVHESEHLVLIGIDIKSFKQLNDTMGPRVGDEILISLASRLNELVESHVSYHKSYANAARISNDFFLLVVTLSQIDEVDVYCQTVRQKLIKSYEIDSMIINFDLYCGVVIDTDNADQGETLLRRVEIAVNAAKDEYTAIRYYETGEDEAYLERISIIENLKDTLASDNGSMFMTFQPKLNLKTEKIDKVEALIRWVNEDGDFVNPELFIDLAEKSGLIVDLTQWVVRNVVRQIADWNEAGYLMKVAINLSAQDIQHDGFIEFILDTIASYSVSASQITLELTERDLMENESQAINRLANLKMVGFEVSIDDYGIGQSSLSKLKDLPANELKIDKGFIMTLEQSDADQVIVKSTIELGHKLGMRVVAEGVENQMSLDILRSFGCDHAQGFYLSKPLKADAFINWLSNYEAHS
ncbi:bifunctional diguanylate cyclase/phosphodiesterase [Bermanella marisrubri]|uniref:Putative HAMP domain/GGDEF domain/EAL domain protein n=1 Tax=Bermanella marisrubri TaxID=207949 RepID=Q1N3A7_9GAMM|nr:EAL domain-containing protein [Bermanella marisrubri]EAT12684.1 putative HAMP domain/GGDEF domain/EAL domain protein [Oceanobacter sp. RED65] [Bermanella marisrubri]